MEESNVATITHTLQPNFNRTQFSSSMYLSSTRAKQLIARKSIVYPSYHATNISHCEHL